MFFSLSRGENSQFPCQHKLGALCLNSDQGWTYKQSGTHDYVYKGYLDTHDLSTVVEQIQDNQHQGNFCVFDHDTATGITQVKTNLYRSFIMWHDGNELTNIQDISYPIWTDSSISISQDLALTENKVDVIGTCVTSPVSRQEAMDFIHDRLQKTTKHFLGHNRLPIKVFLSGGVDSMLVYSYLAAETDDFEIVWANHVEWDDFWCKNQQRIRNRFWAYRQIHHWRQPCVLTSGAPGDEFMLRSPTTADLWLRHHGTSVMDELDKRSNDDLLHKDYFQLEKHIKIFQEQASSSMVDAEQCFKHLANIVANDCQHWHIGNTITFTPLRDLEIFKMLLRLNVEDGIDQILDSTISRELIARNDARLLHYLSDVKNTGESYANLTKLMLEKRSAQISK